MTNPTCVVTGCASARDHGRYCYRHVYARRRKVSTATCARCGAEWAHVKTGPLPKYCSDRCRRGLADSAQCAGCGGVFRQESLRQKYCRPACRHLIYKRGGRPRLIRKACATCGDLIDLAERMADGTLRRPEYVTRCDACMASARPHRYGVTVLELRDRDGDACRWCHKRIDFDLIGTGDRMAPSIDHIIPWSLGGSNDPRNLQLMHRICNSRKGVRVG